MYDKEYMNVALELALKAQGKTWPNPMVGAVVVKNNRIVGRGYHRFCGGDHAEVIALRNAGKNAKGAKLYVTLEPCAHFGRTPPCVDAIIRSGIKEVAIGMIDPNPVNRGKSIAKMKRSGIKTKVGFLKEELRKLNEPFIKYITQRMPFAVAKTGQTLDGKIATAAGESKWITGEESRRFTHRLRDQFDAILVGIKTVLKDNPGLNASGRSKHLKKIIVDSALQTPLSSKLFRHTHPSDIFFAVTKKRNKSKEDILRKKGVHVLVCPSSREGVDLKWLFRELAKREIIYILIEGGAKIIGSALQAKLVDKLLMVIAPKVMGDERALGSVAGIRTKRLAQAVHLNNVTVKRINTDILVEGYVHGNR